DRHRVPADPGTAAQVSNSHRSGRPNRPRRQHPPDCRHLSWSVARTWLPAVGLPGGYRERRRRRRSSLAAARLVVVAGRAAVLAHLGELVTDEPAAVLAHSIQPADRVATDVLVRAATH